MIDIRPATADDLPRIEQIYDAIHTAEETGTASVGWARGVYPTRATAQAALDDGALFVLTDGGALVAAGRIDRTQVPVYAQVPWQYAAPPEQVLVLHTLVVDPTIAGHGYGTQFVRFYAQRARALGCTVLRIDTNAKNAAARRLYARLGFREAAIVPCTFNGIAGVELVCLENGWTQNDTKQKPAVHGLRVFETGKKVLLFCQSLFHFAAHSVGRSPYIRA